MAYYDLVDSNLLYYRSPGWGNWNPEKESYSKYVERQILAERRWEEDRDINRLQIEESQRQQKRQKMKTFDLVEILMNFIAAGIVWFLLSVLSAIIIYRGPVQELTRDHLVNTFLLIGEPIILLVMVIIRVAKIYEK